MSCPHCNAEVESSDRFCRSCGNPLPMRVDPAGIAQDRTSRGRSRDRTSRGRSRGTSWGRGRNRGTGWGRGRNRGSGLVILAHLGLAVGAGAITYTVLHRYGVGAGPMRGEVTLGAPRVVALGPEDPAPGSSGEEAGLEQPIPAGSRPTVSRQSRGRGMLAARTSQPGASSSRAVPTKEVGSAVDLSDGGTRDDVAVGDPRATKRVDAAVGDPRATGRVDAAVTTLDGTVNELDQVRASLNADSIRMVVRHHLPQVRACYERALKQQERISGLVEVRFQITAQGRVGASSVHKNTTGHPGLGKCLAVTIIRWRFPKPVGGETEFIYPFVFSAGE